MSQFYNNMVFFFVPPRIAMRLIEESRPCAKKGETWKRVVTSYPINV